MASILSWKIILLFGLLSTSLVFGENANSVNPESSSFQSQLGSLIRGNMSLKFLNITPRFACNNEHEPWWNLSWEPFNSSDNVTITISKQNETIKTYIARDIGESSFKLSKNISTYYQVKVSNSYGSAISSLASISCQGFPPRVSYPKTNGSEVNVNTTKAIVKWDTTWFSKASEPSSILNISFVDQVTELNYTFTNITNNGSAFVDISSLAMPVSIYGVFITGYANDDPTKTLFGEVSGLFNILPEVVDVPDEAHKPPFQNSTISFS
ncbi:hypothetical protein MDAP_002035 [Mitosporidium daphniae]|uniref:Fibronectin type-III domain-containing protein n=1 Tax=Mitosporidium daphniae TaxID=1485682 RepID=A0A098VUR3_9MICR|nr:uncharacterized protein DI09_36p170 [Mitosporidium daphniae]KGG51406.1 hypothetical protein DI09_36p170 [Mitosporidium daphniae]|eukprot:XP_013237833.1 uncharacterized protein DI09_36p170 [Mitosporidium daphniae]